MKKVLLSMLVMLAGTSAWAQKFTSDGETLTITVTDEANPQKVTEAMNGKNYSKVIVNGGGTISNEFVQNILYTQWGAHSSIKTLDMGDVSLEGATVNIGFYIPSENSWKAGQLNVSKVVLPSNIVTIGEKAFEGANVQLSEVVLPKTLETIGNGAFRNVHLTHIDFPVSLRWIGNEAFATNQKDNNDNIIALRDLKFNEGLEYIGNSAFAVGADYTQKVLVIPASVKFIGPGAFRFRRYQDVYFHGDVAPLCPLGHSTFAEGEMGPFGKEMLDGNNGFDYEAEKHPNRDDWKGTGYANRENYVANGNVYFAMLHYPNNSSNPSTYQDVTRKYETWNDANGNWPNNAQCPNEQGLNPGYKDTYLGEQYIWPSQSQWERSYKQVTAGKNWDDSTYPSANQLSEEQLALLREAGINGSDEQLNKIAYIGTRQFVLGNGDVKSQEHDYPLNVKGGKWYTFCVPFNMTKKMVDEAMGVGTQVCRFSSVERKFDETEKYNRITLLFRADVYKHKTGKTNGVYDRFDNDGTAPSDDDIVVYAHEAYMVKPTKTDADPKSYVVSEYEPEVGSPLPTYITSKNKVREQGMSQFAEEDGAEYRFVGNYLSDARTKIMMPQYTYFFGRMKPEDMGQFWFYDGSSPVKWNANSCIVQTTEAEAGAEDAESFFNVVAGASNKAKQFSIFGEDSSDNNSTTGVDNVTIVAGEDAEVVYSLNGQVASHNGETNSLPKGVYIKNGKKFIVK